MSKIDIDDAAKKYLAGESLNNLAQQLGCDRQLLRYHFRRRKIPIRTVGDAIRLTMSKLDEAGRRRQSAHLRGLADGRKWPRETMERRALVREMRKTNVTKKELQFLQAMRAREITVLQQTAVGPYNVDFSLDGFPVAVEIEGDGWGVMRDPEEYAERLKYILDQGWSVLFVVALYGVDTLMMDKIVAWLDLASRDESTRGKYGMIGRDGKLATVRRANLDHLPRVDGF